MQGSRVYVAFSDCSCCLGFSAVAGGVDFIINEWLRQCFTEAAL